MTAASRQPRRADHLYSQFEIVGPNGVGSVTSTTKSASATAAIAGHEVPGERHHVGVFAGGRHDGLGDRYRFRLADRERARHQLEKTGRPQALALACSTRLHWGISSCSACSGQYRTQAPHE
ncbi:MAG: hypothetical protein R2826_11465 [Thermoleophilia bacterium]